MSEPTGPIPPASEGWSTDPPMNPNPVTEPYAAQAPPEYAPYPAQAPEGYTPYPAQNQPQFQQVFIEKSPQQLEGEKLAKTSTILGIVSICFAGLILGPIAIIKAAKAEKLGVDSTVGKVTGWLGVGLGSLSIVVTLFYIFVFGAIIAAGDMESSDKMGTGGFTQSQELKQNKGNEPKSNFDKTYEKLTPAEKAQMDELLAELDAEISTR